ncbi:unnamed protein product [Microthlaspi erraticum]|uniref:Uncharacterized protein n=1 Tax=Microthlaspi erraticum TaxID=1685480 RepID=A0A6D2LD28_9BRAS|nr:unnamed protein product [Microthlaspi erraticum]
MDQQGRKQAKRSPKELDRVPTIDRLVSEIDRLIDHTQARSIPCKESSIDPASSSIDRTRSSQPFDPSRQMISQPFDLLGANRLDRTTANRIEPKSTPELFRPIFSHCLGYAVFQSFTLFLREKRSNLCFSQFGEDF